MTTISPNPTPINRRLGAALRAERLTALATPAAKLLLGGSVVMAAVSCSANLAAIDDLATDDAVQVAMHASTVATLIFSALAGVYSATTDLRFGLLDHRLLSEPRRAVVLGAKAATAAATGLLYGLLGALTAAVVASLYYWFSGVDFGLLSPLVTRSLIGVIVAAPLFAVIGVALGIIIGNQPTAIGGVLAWFLIVEPILLVGLPGVGKWLPGAAGLAMTNSPDPALLTQVGGGLGLALYAAGAYAIAGQVFHRAEI